jgi:N-hydroxyarylamine O-acetyltransferase
MLLLVAADGARWCADVGFGSQTPTAPLELTADVEQATPHGPFRVRRDGPDWLLEMRAGDDWKALYRFDLQPQHQVDYEVASWYLASHPSSPFLGALIAARAAPGGRHTLLDNVLGWHPIRGAVERRTLAGVDALHEALDTVFGIALERGAEVDAVLERAIRQPDA